MDTAVHGACGDFLRKYPPLQVVGVFFGGMRPAGAKRGAGSKSVKTALSRNPRENARRRFSPRGAVFAPALRGRADPQECHYPTWVAGWPSGAMPRSSASHPRGRAEPAPPR